MVEKTASGSASPKPAAIGVEEEFHTIERSTGRLTGQAGNLMARLPSERFGSELQLSVIEAKSRPYIRLADLADDIAMLRRAVIRAAEPLGLGIVAAGTVPIADKAAVKVTPDPRYERMREEFRTLVDEQLVAAAQIHVDVHDRDVAVAVAHRVARCLPALLALSASSPFWLGADTGYASYRTLIWRRWPTTGAFGEFRSAAAYDRAVAELVRSEVISDQGMIYYDVRPCAHLPTVELRVCDACPLLEDVILLAGLFRALVIREVDLVISGRPPVPVRPELLQAATWRAARSGLEGNLVSLPAASPVPARELVSQMLAELRPVLEATGDWELVAELTESALARGTSAARQRRAHARGGLSKVIEMLVTETSASTGWL